MLTVKQLHKIRRIFKKSGQVSKAWIFGSVARNEETEQSDIDLLFVPDRTNKSFSLYDQIRIENQLKEALHKDVDLVVDGNLKDFIAPFVEKEKILIYEN